ncbi:MAG TPA: hypothetical protein VFQ30_00340 [Ktedonobacteraceae bacterium]|nr:hypothetical protein [Ktedonobacteraceae bacterium]
MPRLEQTQNGNYIIRARLYNSNSIATWQVMGGGVTFLNRRGIYAGQQFHQSLLQELIEQHLVFTGGSGVHTQSQVDTTNTINIRKSIAPTKTQVPFKKRQPGLKLRKKSNQQQKRGTFR